MIRRSFADGEVTRFDVWPGADVPVLEGLAPWLVAGPVEQRRECTRWFDTADRRLAAAGALAVRHEHAWWVVLPPETSMANRWVDAGPPGDDGVAVEGLLRAYIGRARLEPVIEVEIQSSCHVMLDGAGRVVAELRDEAFVVRDGDSVSQQFRQMSLACAPGAPDTVRELVTARVVVSGATPAGVDLATRVLGPSPVLLADDESGSAAASVQAALARALSDARRHLTRLTQAISEDDVHQARVGLRRFRSIVRDFLPAVDAAWAAAALEESSWLAAELGRVRDYQVLAVRLADHADQMGGSDAEELRRAVDRLEQGALAAADDLAVTLRSDRFAGVIETLAQPVTVETDRSMGQMLRVVARRAIAALESASGSDDIQSTHRARIRVKRLRYGLEAAQGLRGAKALRRRLTQLQTGLGDAVDGAAVEQWCRQEAFGTADLPEGHPRPGLAVVLGRVVESERAIADHGRQEWGRQWRRLRGDLERQCRRW